MEGIAHKERVGNMAETILEAMRTSSIPVCGSKKAQRDGCVAVMAAASRPTGRMRL